MKVIYELEPDVMLTETVRQLDKSRNAISHVGFAEPWVRQHGKVVYRDDAITRAVGSTSE